MILTLARSGDAGRWRSWYLLLPLAAAALRGVTQATVELGLDVWPSPFAAALIGYIVSTVVVLTAARIGAGPFVADAPVRGLLWFVAVGWCNGLAALLMYAALAMDRWRWFRRWLPAYPLVTVVGTTLLFGEVEGGARLALGVALTVVGVALLIAG